MSNIPNADLIRAILDGKTVQKRFTGGGEWRDAAPAASIETLASGSLDYEFRIKAETVVLWAITNGKSIVSRCNEEDARRERSPAWRILRLELDAETLNVISVRTEEP